MPRCSPRAQTAQTQADGPSDAGNRAQDFAWNHMVNALLNLEYLASFWGALGNFIYNARRRGAPYRGLPAGSAAAKAAATAAAKAAGKSQAKAAPKGGAVGSAHGE